LSVGIENPKKEISSFSAGVQIFFLSFFLLLVLKNETARTDFKFGSEANLKVIFAHAHRHGCTKNLK
jgi:hypothetical protein